MKKETGKNSKLWLWLTVMLVAVLAIAGILLAIFLKPEQPVDLGSSSELYWNVDRETYTKDSKTGLSTRVPEADGLFHVRLAGKAGLIEVKIADRQLINYLDMLNAVGIVTDAEGIVVDILEANTIAAEVVAGFYVSDFDSTSVTVNSSIAMNGMSNTVTISDETGIFLVSPDAEVPGETT